MKKQLNSIALGVAATLVSLCAHAVPAVYTPVTDARLKNPEPSNWLSTRGNYAGWGYSPLDQITTKNVDKLELVWAVATGQKEGHQAAAIVNNGYMYVTTPGAQVIALDAKTGDELWRYKRELAADLLQLHPTNRGVALYGDKVYVANVDCHLVALDATTGKVVWDIIACDKTGLEYMTMAPLAANGKIVVGMSGGEVGARGYLTAYDAETGKEVWRTFTVPGPGEPGGNTWPAGDAYKTGGGTTWITGTYDSDTNLLFWGTGNPAPWDRERREGDNLYTTSVLALDLDTGAIKGHHQYHHNDAWDWDEVTPPLLIDTEIKGKKVKAAVHAGRSGYLWMLERTTSGKINFIDAKQYVHNNVFTSIDPKTGRPSYHPDRIPGAGKTVGYCPTLWGGKDWPAAAWSPKTRLYYIPANNNLCAELPPSEPEPYVKGKLFFGFPIPAILESIRWPNDKKPVTIGEIQAWDLNTGKQVWTHKFPTHNWGTLLATGGDLLFAGGTNDRKFRALDARNGKVLWETPTPSGVTGVPTSFELDGEQYVSVVSGWGVDAQLMESGINMLTGKKNMVPQGGTIMVYKLPKK